MRKILVLGLCALCASSAAAEDKNGGWTVIEKERGIVVTTREEPGRELPTFRGRGKIKAPLLHALAVVLDAEGATKWAVAIDEVKMLRPIDEYTHLIYTRSHAAWPVSDRDMVVKRKVEVVKPGHEYKISIICQPKGKEKGEVRKVVRVTQCESHFNLKKVDENTTYADYQVNLNPEGRLPTWLVKWASKRIPFDTLVNLEKHVGETKGKYASEIRTWAAAEPASALSKAEKTEDSTKAAQATTETN